MRLGDIGISFIHSCSVPMPENWAGAPFLNRAFVYLHIALFLGWVSLFLVKSGRLIDSNFVPKSLQTFFLRELCIIDMEFKLA